MDSTPFWDNAYRSNAPRLLGTLRRYVSSRELAEDLLHEVFITAIQKYGSFSKKGSFEGWLHRIAVNAALMHIRSSKLNKAPEALMDVIVNERAADDEEQQESVKSLILTADFSNDDLLHAIDRLPEHHKLVFNLYVMDGFTHRQIGKELGISAGTSKSHLARARKKVQQYLYQEALNKKNKKNRKWAFLLFVLPTKDHYIDKLYRKQLGKLNLPASGSTAFMSEAVQQSAAAKLATSTAFWGSKLFYTLVAGGSIAVVATVCWVAVYSENAKIDMRLPTPVMVDSLATQPTPVDSAAGKVVPATTVESAKDQPSLPVVVKKTVIQHRTVVVRDTVIIEE